MLASSIRSSSAAGFCVGCFPNDFSSFLGAAIVQTVFICLPPFILRILS